MGFTEKASCRPYKNCYKSTGGSKKIFSKNRKMPASSVRKTKKSRRVVSRKRSSRGSRGSIMTNNKVRKNEEEPLIAVFKQSYSYSSNPAPGMPFGQVVAISYKNGKTKKMEAELNKQGLPINTKRSLKTKPVKSTPAKR